MNSVTAFDSQLQAGFQDISISSLPPQSDARPARVGFFDRWGKRPIAATTSGPEDPSLGTCGRCEELKIQPDINQSMLSDCAARLTDHKEVLEISKDLAQKLQARPDKVETTLRLKQKQFEIQLKAKDKQLDAQLAKSRLHIATSKELVAHLTDQYKTLTEARAREKQQFDSVRADLENKLTSMKIKLEIMDGRLNDVQGDEGEAKGVNNTTGGGAGVETGQQRGSLEQEATSAISIRAIGDQTEPNDEFVDELEECRRRVAHLKLENEKMHAQLSGHDAVGDEEDSEF